MTARALALAALASACFASTANAASWDTFGFDLTRTGFNPKERTLGPANVGGLREVWSAPLGGVSNTQPTLAAGVALPGGRRADLVFAGSEAGRFSAFDAATGERVWSRRVGTLRTSCVYELPGGRFGATATPAIDRKRRRVYAAGGTSKVYALDIATGKTKKGWPAAVTRDFKNEHIWAALTLARGRLYVATARHCVGSPFHGRLVVLDSKGRRLAKWHPTRSRAGGGIWGWGGLSVEPANGDIYTAVGNSEEIKENYGYAEHVVRLSPRLRVLASNYPNPPKRRDNDFGATPMLYEAPGCPPQLALLHKTGRFYVYDRRSIERGPTQSIVLTDPEKFGSIGTYAYSAATRTVYVGNRASSADGRYSFGLVALAVGFDCRLRLAWQQPVGVSYPELPAPPVVANGIVYFASGTEVYAFADTSGRPLWRSGAALKGKVYAAPSVVNGRLYVASWDGRLHAFAP